MKKNIKGMALVAKSMLRVFGVCCLIGTVPSMFIFYDVSILENIKIALIYGASIFGLLLVLVPTYEMLATAFKWVRTHKIQIIKKGVKANA